MKRSLPAIFHYLVGILLLVRSRRSPLRLQTHNQPSAQQSNETCSESNDRLGLKLKENLTRDFAGQKEVDFEILDRSEKQLIGDRRD